MHQISSFAPFPNRQSWKKITLIGGVTKILNQQMTSVCVRHANLVQNISQGQRRTQIANSVEIIFHDFGASYSKTSTVGSFSPTRNILIIYLEQL